MFHSPLLCIPPCHRFRSKEALIKHKEKFCEASESIYSNPVLLKRQLQQELALSLENDDGRKKALLAKQSITATSLSFDEVRNFLVNGQGDNLLGKVSLGEVRRKFQANESDLEADRARALQNLQQERNQHLNDLKDDSKEARKEKLQAEEKLLERIRALEEARSKEMEARVAKTRVQKSLQGIAKPQLELLEKEKKQQMDLLMKEREALERREDEIKESIQKMEKRLLREYTHAEQLKREQAEFERAQKMGIQGINVDGLTAQLRDKAKAHDGDIARLEEERETLRLKQSSLFQRLSSLPNQAEIVSMQPQEVDHFLSNLKDKTTHQDMVLMQMQAEKKRQRDRENRLLKQAYQFDSNGNFMQELNHDGNSISSSKSNDSGLICGSGDGVGGDGGAHSRKTPPQYGRRSSLGGNVGSNNHLSSSKSTSALLGGLQSITGSNGNGSSTNIGTDANVNRTVRSGRRRYSINTMKGGIESTPAPGSGRNSGRKMGRRSQSLATFSVGEGEPNSGLRGRARERMTRNGHHPISNLTSGRPNATGNAFTTPQRSSMPLQNNYSVNGNNDNSNNNNNNNYSISDNPLWQEIQDLKREYERSGGQNSNLLAQIQQLERDMQSLPLPHHSNNQPSHIHNSAQDHQSYNAVAGVAPGMSTQAQAYIGRGGSIEQQLRQQNQLLVQQRLENTRMTQYLEETAMRAERSRVMDQRAGFEKNMMALNYRLNRVFSGKGPGRSMGRSGDDIDDDGEQGEGGGKGRGKTFSDDPVLRAYEKLQCLPKDSPLYQMEMSHVLSMTKLRYEQELLDKKHQLEKKKLEMARIKAEEQGERKHQEEAARHKRQIEINKLQLLEQQTNPVLIAQRELAKQQQAMMMANGGHMANNAAVNDNGAAYSMGMGANARANVNGRSVNAMNANNNYGATSEHAHLHPMIPHLQSMQPSRQKGTVAMIDAPYQPKKGFVFFVDYVVGINNKYSKIENGRVRLVYRLYNDAKSIPKQEFNRSKNTLVKHSQLPSPPSPSAPETGPARPTTYSITKAKTVFENVSANPKYKMIVEVQLIKPAQSKPTTPSSTSSSQSANDKPTVISLGWTAVQLFRPVPAGENGNRKSNSKKKSKHDKKGRTNSTDSNDRSRETRNSDNENDDHSADAGDGGDNAILASGAFVLPLFKRPMKLETSPFKLMGDTMHLPTQGAHQPLKKLKLYVRILPFALGTSLMPNRNPAKTMSQYYPFVAVPSVLSRFLAMMKNMKAIAADSSDDDSDEEDDEDEEEVEEHDEVDGDGNGGNEEKYRDQASDNEEDADGDSGDDDGDDQARKGSGFDDDGNGEFGGGKRLKRRSHSLKVTAGQVNTVTGIVEYTKKGKKKKKKNTQAEEEEEKKRERDAVAEEMSKAKPSKSFSSFGLVMDHWEQEAFSIGEFSRVKATIYTPQTNRTTGANRAMTGVFGLDGDDSKVDFDNDNDIGNDDSSRNMNNNRYNDNENDNNDIDVGPAVRKFLPTRNDKTGRVIEWYTPYAQLGVGGELGITQWKKQAVLKRVPITEDTWMVLEIMQVRMTDVM